MRDREQRELGELGAQQHLHLLVGDGVEVGGGFIEHEHGPPLQQRAREAEQLPLARREVGAALIDCLLEHLGRQPCALQRSEHLCPSSALEGVEVVRHRARVQHGFLRDDRDALAHALEADGLQLASVDEDAAAVRRQPEEREHLPQ